MFEERQIPEKTYILLDMFTHSIVDFGIGVDAN